MTKVIYYVGLIGFVLISMWSSEHVSYAQDFYAAKTTRIVVGLPLEAALIRLLKEDSGQSL